MRQRTALIGPFTHGGISVIQDVCNEAPFLKEMQYIDISGVLFTTMFQVGVDLFELYSFDDELAPRSVFFLKRTSIFSKDVYDEVGNQIHDIFRPFLPQDYSKNIAYSAIWKWESFLTDLLYCLKRNCAMVFGDIPDAENIRGLLPDELLIPIINLVENIAIESLKVPIAKVSLPEDSLKRFQDIVESDFFRIYVERHGGLDDAKKPKKLAIRDIVNSSMVLQYNYPTLLKLRDIAFSVIPITAKLVDTIFGKLPGSAADAFTKHLDRWIDSQRRIVIYETGPFLMEILFKRLIFCLENEKKLSRTKALT